MIEAEALSRRFGERVAVRDVTFGVGEGEVFGFLGPNGAGKSTTISMLCTLLRPTAGRARVNGHDVIRDRRDVRRSIGLVFQQTTLDDALTAEQNLRFHAYAYDVPARTFKARAAELLDLVELSDRRDDRVKTFSGGMKRRLEIARGLLHHPRVLFLDEPTLGLDPQTRRRIWDYLAALRAREGLTIFLTTHYLDEAEACDRIAVIDRGSIIALDTPAGLKASVGGDVVTLTTPRPDAAAREIGARHGIAASVSGDILTFTVEAGDAFLPDFVRTFGQPLETIGVRRPTLDDVFVGLTGREIRDETGQRSEVAA